VAARVSDAEAEAAAQKENASLIDGVANNFDAAVVDLYPGRTKKVAEDEVA